jgi:hypothetical protein
MMSDATILRGLSSTSIEQIGGNLLRIEDNYRLASNIEVCDIA